MTEVYQTPTFEQLGRPTTRSWNLFQYFNPASKSSKPVVSKSIAIIGASTGGIGTLLGLFDIPQVIRKTWSIEVLERRNDVGGVWLPDPDPVPPPKIPESPLYPALHTNTALPTMTYPSTPFPQDTPLFPNHSHILKYHRDVVQKRNLSQYIKLSHSVESAHFDRAISKWILEIETPDGLVTREYDSLVVANGHNKYPYKPELDGSDEWLSQGNGQDRQIVHSLWYRGAEAYKGRTVIVAGAGASGWDIAHQSIDHAKAVYHSYTGNPEGFPRLPPVPGAIHVERIARFTKSSIVFTDGTSISPEGPVTVVLATGYQLLAPFLKDLHVNPITTSTRTLTTNSKYIRPLFRQLVAIDPTLPKDALFFVGLPFFIANAPSDYAQGLFVGHVLADPNFLPSFYEMHKDLDEYEEEFRKNGAELFQLGHKFVAPLQAEKYQEDLITLIRKRSSVSLPSFLQDANVKFVEEWRVFGRSKGMLLRKAWLLAVQKGVEEQFYKGAVTEEEWAKKIYELDAWYEKETSDDSSSSSPSKEDEGPVRTYK